MSEHIHDAADRLGIRRPNSLVRVGPAMTARSGYDFRGRQIPPSTRADWRHDARPTNYDGGRTAILARRIIRLLDALDEAEADLAQAWADGYNHAKVETLTLPTGDPAGVVADEAYVAGYQDGVTQALRWAATEWPEDGMTRAEAQAWLEQQAARLLCKGHQSASPTRQPCAACVQTATAATAVWTCPDCEGEFPVGVGR